MSQSRLSFSPGLVAVALAGPLCLLLVFQRPVGGQWRESVPDAPSAEQLELNELYEDLAWGVAEIRERTMGNPRECRIQQDEFEALNATQIQRARELSLALLAGEAAAPGPWERAGTEEMAGLTPAGRELAILGEQIATRIREANASSDNPRERREIMGAALAALEPEFEREDELLAALAEAEQDLPVEEPWGGEVPPDAPAEEASRLRHRLAAGMLAIMAAEIDPRNRRLEMDAFMAANAALFALEERLSATRDPLSEVETEQKRTDESEPD